MNFIAVDTVTLFNWETLQTGGKLHRTVIDKVNYQGLKTAFLSGVTNVTGDTVNVVIPLVAEMSKPYVIYAEWLKLTDKSTHWTLADNTYIVNGIKETTATTTTQLEKELKPVKVTGFDLYTLKGLEHWSVVAK